MNALTDVSVVVAVLRDINVIPKISLELKVENMDAVLEAGPAQDALVIDLTHDVAASLSINPSVVQISGLRNADLAESGRRRSQSRAGNLAFDIVISGRTAADSLQLLVEQINDPESALMRTHAGGKIDPTVMPSFDFECPPGTMRLCESLPPLHWLHNALNRVQPRLVSC